MNKLRFLPLILLISACSWFEKSEDPIDKLPPLTTEGKNTFGCLVNGQAFLPKGHFSSSGLTAQSQERGWLTIGSSNDTESIKLIIRDEREIGEKTYFLGQLPKGAAKYIDFSQKVICFYDAEELIDGHVEIVKFSREERIVSGTFEFRIFDQECGDTVTVTHGRFDIGGLIL